MNITYPQPKKKRASYSVTIQSSHKTKSALVANKRNNQGPKNKISALVNDVTIKLNPKSVLVTKLT